MDVEFRPINDHLLIRLQKIKDETKSGLKLVQSKEDWQHETIIAEVMAITAEEKDVKVGDIVVIRGDAGRWIDPGLVDDNEFTYRLIDKNEVLSIVVKKAADLTETPPELLGLTS
jgi:co-chaperonin GroES (HSP10)